MKKKKLFFNILVAIAIIWAILTLIAQQSGPKKQFIYTSEKGSKKALVVYSPDFIYNFDEQICRAFAEGLYQKGWSVDVLSVKAAWDFSANDYDLAGLCANTYNWSPDWSITHFIKAHEALEGMTVVAITLGSGSTARAQRKFEEKINQRKSVLLRSEKYWLLRPNDETKLDESNIAVALAQAKDLGIEVGIYFDSLLSDEVAY